MSQFETRIYGDVTLIRGDCMEVITTLAAKSVDMVFADLPYGVTNNFWDICISLPNLWTLIDLKARGGACLAFTATQPFASSLISSNKKHFRYDLIWHKNMSTGFFHANIMPLRSHESVLIFYSKIPTYNPQKNKLTKETNTSQSSPTTSTNYNKKDSERKLWVADGTRHPTSVLPIKIESGRKRGLHPTQKPVALLEWLIKTYTNPGDLVLDPVSGSATTAIAALNTGRRAICIEKDPVYYEVGCKRVAEHMTKMEAAREPV